MTPYQKKALEYLNRYWDNHGHSPSYRDISYSINTGVSHCHEIINGLVERGFVYVDRKKARAIYPIDVWHKLRGEENVEPPKEKTKAPELP